MGQDNRSAEWLMETAGPIVRYRTARELLDGVGHEVESLRREALACDEAQRWIGLLDGGNWLHGAEDAFLENTLSKLGLYGLTVDTPEIAEKVNPYVDRHEGTLSREAMILLSSLASVGYTDGTVEAMACERVDCLAATATDQVFDFLKSDAHESAYSPKWRDKPIYRDELADRIPWVYDLLACATMSHTATDGRTGADTIEWIDSERWLRYEMAQGKARMPHTARLYRAPAGVPCTREGGNDGPQRRRQSLDRRCEGDLPPALRRDRSGRGHPVGRAQ